MTASPLATGMIVLGAVLALAFWLGLVLLAARRPYFKHPHPDSMPGKVRGGMHLGDPRSQGPPEGERADAGAPAAGAERADEAESTGAAQRAGRKQPAQTR